MDLEEALAQADTYSVDEEICTIDNDLRTITIPSGLQTVGVESDEDVRRLNFQMPKQYDEVDLSAFDIRINYLNANGNGDIYVVTDKEVSGDYITFSWLLGRNAMAYKGSICFIVCLKKTGEEGIVQQEFNTTIAQLTVLEGLETTQKVIQENPDVIEEILKRLDDLEENGGGGSGSPGQDGVGIEKIEKTGTQGLVDTYTITLTNSSTYTFTVTNGQDGTPGAKGDPGQAATIQIGTVTTGEPGTAASVTNSGTANAVILDFVIPKGAQGDNSSGGGLTVTYDEETETIVFSDNSLMQAQSETQDVTATAQNLVRTFTMPTGETATIPEVDETSSLRLLRDITLDEEVGSVEILNDENEEAFECDEIVINIKSVGTTMNESISNKNAILYISGVNVGYIPGIGFSSGLTRVFTLNLKVNPFRIVGGSVNSNDDLMTGNTLSNILGYSFTENIQKINAVKIAMRPCVFGVGSRIQIYGR